MRYGDDHHGTLSDSVDDAKGEALHWALAVYLIDRRESFGLGSHGGQGDINGVSESDCRFGAPLGIPVERLVEIAARTREIVNR